MGITSEELKKHREIVYLEEVRRASSIFPDGELIPHERPDFLLLAEGRTIGIEVTELCREEARAEGGRLSKVAPTAQDRYNRLANAYPMEVSVTLAPRIESIAFNRLVNGLVKFVHDHREHTGCFNWNNDDLPEGYSYIAVHAAREAGGKFRAFKAFDTTPAPQGLVRLRIAEKLSCLPEYRKAAPENWLLIVNDQFLGPGAVYLRPGHITQRKFDFDFDRVLLFLRELGGSGEVIEVQRDCASLVCGLSVGKCRSTN